MIVGFFPDGIDFHTWEKADAVGVSSFPGPFKAAEMVVFGNRERRDFPFRGDSHQFLGSPACIGKNNV